MECVADLISVFSVFYVFSSVCEFEIEFFLFGACFACLRVCVPTEKKLFNVCALSLMKRTEKLDTLDTSPQLINVLATDEDERLVLDAVWGTHASSLVDYSLVIKFTLQIVPRCVYSSRKMYHYSKRLNIALRFIILSYC